MYMKGSAMEPEAIIEQDIAPTQEAEVLEETPVMAEEPVAPAEVAAEGEQPQAVDEAQASDGQEEATAEQAEAEDAATETPTSNSVADMVATEDVAPAQSRMDLAKLAKEALIERAKEMADSTDWRKTSEEQRSLMEEWRKVGYAGKDVNDKLWEDFRAARQEFFSRREAEVVKIKQEIIAQAREVTTDVKNWVGTAAELDTLMQRWKTAGNSGSEQDKELWNEFNGIRRDFRNRRKADLDDRRAKANQNADAKRAIVDEAKQIADSASYTRENSDRMRQLDKDYKAIGFAGKPANDELWAAFSEAKKSYWDGNNAHRDAQRRKRSERLQEAVERKSDQIEHLKSQNETLTTRLGSTLDPEKIAKIKSWIAQNDERAADLEGDVAEIKSKI